MPTLSVFISLAVVKTANDQNMKCIWDLVSTTRVPSWLISPIRCGHIVDMPINHVLLHALYALLLFGTEIRKFCIWLGQFHIYVDVLCLTITQCLFFMSYM